MSVNYHFHDRASSDARGDLAEHVAAAARAGIVEVCATNHVERLGPDGGWTVDPDEAVPRFRAVARAAREAEERWPEVTVRVGAEFEYRPEWKAPLERLAAEVELDFVIGSVHRVDGLNVSGGDEVEEYFGSRGREEAYEAYFRAVTEMVEWGAFDAVGHFDLVKRFGFRHHGPYRPREFEGPIREALETMAAAGIGIEVNTSGVVQAPGEPYPGWEVLAWAREAGVPFLTVGTDSHAPETFGQGLHAGYGAARRAGWEEVARFRGREPAASRSVSERPSLPAPRAAHLSRESAETRVRVRVDLGGRGRVAADTGIGFFDHMLEQLARHSAVDLEVEAEGDLGVDEHHTVEDVGLVLGRALSRALGERRGIRRYGFLLPMDDALARVAVDLGGRTHVEFRADFSRQRVGELPTELVEEFVRALARGLEATVHVRLESGRNAHHEVESVFKALGRALGGAAERDPRLGGELPTTKGLL